MGKKLAAGDLDIDIDSLVSDAMNSTTGVEYTPMGEGIAKAFTKKKSPDDGLRSEAAKRLRSGGDSEVSEGFDKKIKSGVLPEMKE